MRNKKDIQNEILNNKIRSSDVRLIDDQGVNKGTVPTKDALEMAQKVELDLVLISPQASPPVAKIMDYGKYKFELQKKKKENKSKQHKVSTKEVRLSPTIDQHDFEVKIRQAIKFLEKGDKVQFVLRFRGRMITHKELGYDVISKAIKAVELYSEVDQRAKMDGRKMFAIVVPQKK